RRAGDADVVGAGRAAERVEIAADLLDAVIGRAVGGEVGAVDGGPAADEAGGLAGKRDLVRGAEVAAGEVDGRADSAREIEAASERHGGRAGACAVDEVHCGCAAGGEQRRAASGDEGAE